MGGVVRLGRGGRLVISDNLAEGAMAAAKAVGRPVAAEVERCASGRKRPVRWSEGLEARLLGRLAAGEMLYRVLASEPGMPTPEAVAKEVRTILFRHFKIEEDPETGEREVVAYCPNPITGQVEREDTPGWRQAGDANTSSLPGGRGTGQGYWTREREG